MADGMREKTTNVGGVIKRIWYAMTGATQGAQLLSLDDSGNLDSLGNILTSGKIGITTGTSDASSPKSPIQIGTKANIFNGAGNAAANWLDLGYNIYFGGAYRYTAGNGRIGDEASLLEIGEGLAYYTAPAGSANATMTLTKRLFITKDIFQVPLLAGTGNRAVYSDAIGNLTNSSSDERVKKNVKNITETMNVLEVLKNIRGITYNWDNAIEGYENMGEQEEIGVIAQEIEHYIPQIVGENQTGYKSVDYAKLTAFLIETNKALLERVESLESKVV